MSFHTYSADRVSIVWNSFIINGYANDTFVEVERDEDTFMKYTGALGVDVARSRNLNRGAQVTITLMAVAPVNDLLTQFAFDDENGIPMYAPLQIKDASGNMLCHAEIAWVKKMPSIERGKESGTVQWVFDCASMIVLPNGNLPESAL